MLNMKRKFLISTFIVGFAAFSACSSELSSYEHKIKKEAESFNQDLSSIEIKKRALRLTKWSSLDYFEKDIQKFLDQDKASPPPRNAILFIGSSSIVFWKTLETDMHPFRVINRGFGGSHIAHVNNYLEEIVLPYNPRGIVFYCGGNDIFGLKTPEEVLQDFLHFYKTIKANLPEVKVFVIGIKPSAAREYQKVKHIQWNDSVAKLSDKNENLFFIDVRPTMLLENGKPNPDLFVEDGLHMNSKGYAIWTKLLKPYLESNFKPDKTNL